jgi:hypothetical protein
MACPRGCRRARPGAHGATSLGQAHCRPEVAAGSLPLHCGEMSRVLAAACQPALTGAMLSLLFVQVGGRRVQRRRAGHDRCAARGSRSTNNLLLPGLPAAGGGRATAGGQRWHAPTVWCGVQRRCVPRRLLHGGVVRRAARAHHTNAAAAPPPASVTTQTFPPLATRTYINILNTTPRSRLRERGGALSPPCTLQRLQTAAEALHRACPHAFPCRLRLDRPPVRPSSPSDSMGAATTSPLVVGGPSVQTSERVREAPSTVPSQLRRRQADQRERERERERARERESAVQRRNTV